MKEQFTLSGEDDRRQEVPLSLLNTWVRKRLLRVYAPADESAAGSSLREVKDRVLAARIVNGATIVAHPSIAKLLAPVKAGTGAVATMRDVSRASSDSKPPPWVNDCIRFAGKELVVISKPDGIASQGGTGIDERRTVDYWLPTIDAAAGRFAAASSSKPAVHAGKSAPAKLPADATQLKLVHRLDKDVSGLLLLARGREAAERVRVALAGRYGVRKEYVAIVHAHLPRGVKQWGVIDAPVTDGPPLQLQPAHLRGNLKGADRASQGRGQQHEQPQAQLQAMTEYVAVQLGGQAKPASAAASASTPVAASGAGDAAGASAGSAPAPELPPLTLLLLRPVTGRKHQLRQHVRALFRGAAAIAGDRKYGAEGAGSKWQSRLLLHAWRLTIDSDVLGHEVHATSTLGTSEAPRSESVDGDDSALSFRDDVRKLVMGSQRNCVMMTHDRVHTPSLAASCGAESPPRSSNVAGRLRVTDDQLPVQFCGALLPYLR